MSERAIKIGIVSDAHLSPAPISFGAWGKRGDLAPALLERTVSEFHGDGCAAIVNLGDLIEDSDSERDRRSLAEGRLILEGAGLPVHHLLGNHDHERITPAEARAILGGGPLNHTFRCGPIRGVALFAECGSGGRVIRFGRSTAEWLRETLREPIPTLVFSHYPLVEFTLEHNEWFKGYPDYCFPEDRNEVCEILENAPYVIGALSGHLHQTVTGLRNGLGYVTVGALTESFGCGEGCQETRAVLTWDESGVRLDVRGRFAGAYNGIWRRDARVTPQR